MIELYQDTDQENSEDIEKQWNSKESTVLPRGEEDN